MAPSSSLGLWLWERQLWINREVSEMWQECLHGREDCWSWKCTFQSSHGLYVSCGVPMFRSHGISTALTVLHVTRSLTQPPCVTRMVKSTANVRESVSVCPHTLTCFCFPLACYGKHFGPKGVGFGQGAGTLSMT